MIFLSYWFLIFVTVLLSVYWLVRSPRIRLGLLLLSCIIFHAHFAGPAGVLPIIVLSVITYSAGLTRKKPYLIAAIVICASALVFYKYTTFLSAQVIGAVFPHAGSFLLHSLHDQMPRGIPLAISFFVFEFIHYLYDVSKGEAPIRNPGEFGLFAIFWPSLVAGPVKRYQQFLPALHKGVRTACTSDFALGACRVAIGLAKKAIADNLTAYLKFWQPKFATLPAETQWAIFFSLALRILFDFSGYSDMAIGYARMMGICLPENFYWPYGALSIAEFWRRWHISLSSWIRDYIYIPLGGSRYGLARKILAGLFAFGICGLWHGAAWNTVVWGVYHGVGLAINVSYVKVLGKPGQLLNRALSYAKPVSWALTMAYVCVGWLFFFYPLADAWDMLLTLLGVS
jgi:alginate O-acetyltransferase complex protein AlgI